MDEASYSPEGTGQASAEVAEESATGWRGHLRLCKKINLFPFTQL